MTKTKINLKQKTKNQLVRNKGRMIYFLNIFFLILVISLAFAHFIQFTGAASEGFVLRELNSQLSELKNQNKELNLLSAQLQSIERVKNQSEKNLGMIASTGFDYITLKSSPLSLK